MTDPTKETTVTLLMQFIANQFGRADARRAASQPVSPAQWLAVTIRADRARMERIDRLSRYGR